VSGTLAYPNYVSALADETALFYTDDPNNSFTSKSGPATLVKCSLPTCATPTPWGAGFFTTYTLLTGSARVFFMAASDVAGSKKALFACGLTTPCTTPPKKLIESPGLDRETFGEQADTVYMTSADQGAILQIAPDGTITTFASAQSTPVGIAFDSGWVYWFGVTQSQGKGIYTADLRRKKADGSGAIESVLCGLSSPTAILLDSRNVYFTESNPSGGTNVVRAIKPP
jgi:hypothetical protein